MNPIRVTKYQCPTCDELHDSYLEAEDCCQPEAGEVTCWECSVCDEVYQSEDVARLCCYEGDEPLPATPAQLEAAGQQRLPL